MLACVHSVLDVGAHLLQSRQNVGRWPVECVLCASVCMCNNMVPTGMRIECKKLDAMCAACACPTSYSEFRRQPQEEEAMEGQGEVEGGPWGERECCLLVLNLVSSTLPCIRRPRPRLRVLDVRGFV